jgi:hypothetical protein
LWFSIQSINTFKTAVKFKRRGNKVDFRYTYNLNKKTETFDTLMYNDFVLRMKKKEGRPYKNIYDTMRLQRAYQYVSKTAGISDSKISLRMFHALNNLFNRNVDDIASLRA